MGWFSCTEVRAPSRARTPITSETQAAEFRICARRRLVGATVMVLVAAVILSLVLNPEPDRVMEKIPIRLLESPKVNGSSVASPPFASANLMQVPRDLKNADVPLPPPLSSAVPDSSQGQQIVPAPSSVDRRLSSSQSTLETKTLDSKSPLNRSDDGARAIALLEGRNPLPATQSRPIRTSSFVLQIASYTVRVDADIRRKKLHAAGLTNAFVQVANIGVRKQFRLRVGPFPSRDAAQAAQARLRTLGYDNGFIATQ